MFTGVASLLCTKVHRAVKTFKNVFALPDGVIAYIFKLNVLAYSVVFFHIRLNFYIFSKITELKFRRRIARSDGGLLWRCIAQCESTERMLRSEALIERGSPTCSLAGSSLSLSLSLGCQLALFQLFVVRYASFSRGRQLPQPASPSSRC